MSIISAVDPSPIEVAAGLHLLMRRVDHSLYQLNQKRRLIDVATQAKADLQALGIVPTHHLGLTAWLPILGSDTAEQATLNAEQMKEQQEKLEETFQILELCQKLAVLVVRSIGEHLSFQVSILTDGTEPAEMTERDYVLRVLTGLYVGMTTQNNQLAIPSDFGFTEETLKKWMHEATDGMLHSATHRVPGESGRGIIAQVIGASLDKMAERGNEDRYRDDYRIRPGADRDTYDEQRARSRVGDDRLRR